MRLFSPIKHRLKIIEKIVNNLGELLNARTIIKGNGISLTEGPNGVEISLESLASIPNSVSPSASTSSTNSTDQTSNDLWILYKDLVYSMAHPPNPMPPSGTFTPWMTGAKLGWLSVSTVDPVTCARTTIAVWSYFPGEDGGGGL